MLKPKKGFIQAQLNIEKLSPLQWDGILRAMDAYAEHYHEEKVNELRQQHVIGSVCDGCGSKFDAMDISVGVCYCCQKEIKQTDL